MLYATIDHTLGHKSLYQCKSQKALDWLIGWKSRRGYDCQQCTESEARAIAAEIGAGGWQFDIGKNKAGEYVRMPYRYWRAID